MPIELGLATSHAPGVWLTEVHKWERTFERFAQGVAPPPEAAMETTEVIEEYIHRIRNDLQTIQDQLTVYKPDLLIIIGGDQDEMFDQSNKPQIMIWTGGDMMCRGFLMGGTAGRTTLNGEGLQHQDGHSQLVAETIPNLKSYDPAFAYELAIIIHDGIRRMYEEQEEVFYYITVYNEAYVMPPLPLEDPTEGILRGLYKYRPSGIESAHKAHVLASGPIVQQALAAARLLEQHGIAADVWSVTSFNELYRDALACERFNRMHPMDAPRMSFLESSLADETGVFISVSDYMKALGSKLAKWIPGEYIVLGTDGYGLSESRAALRQYFEINPEYIALAALEALARGGAVSREEVAAFIAENEIDVEKRSPVDF